jgi:hypothetical protein
LAQQTWLANGIKKVAVFSIILKRLAAMAHFHTHAVVNFRSRLQNIAPASTPTPKG